MFIKKGVVTQTGNDVFTSAAIETNLTADGKAGWEIFSIKAYWPVHYSINATDLIVNLILATVPTLTTFDSLDEIGRINWAVANTGGVAVAYPVNSIKEDTLQVPRITVQPQIYVQASSTGAVVPVAIFYELAYDIVKLTDLEVLKMLQGGA